MLIDSISGLETAISVLYEIATRPDDGMYISGDRNRIAAAEALGHLCLGIEGNMRLVTSGGVPITVPDPNAGDVTRVRLDE